MCALEVKYKLKGGDEVTSSKTFFSVLSCRSKLLPVLSTTPNLLVDDFSISLPRADIENEGGPTADIKQRNNASRQRLDDREAVNTAP